MGCLPSPPSQVGWEAPPTPASLKTPPNALVTHLMTMTSLLLGSNLEFVIMHSFQISELQNVPFILFVDFGI